MRFLVVLQFEVAMRSQPISRNITTIRLVQLLVHRVLDLKSTAQHLEGIIVTSDLIVTSAESSQDHGVVEFGLFDLGGQF